MKLGITVPFKLAADTVNVRCEECGDVQPVPVPIVAADSPLAAFVFSHAHDSATSTPSSPRD